MTTESRGKLLSVLSLLLIGALLPSIALTAQGDDEQICRSVWQAAVTNASLECAGLVPGEACYGNLGAAVDTVDGSEFSFPGNRVGVEVIETIQADTPNFDERTWPLVVMQLATDMPEQPATLVLIGAAEVENLSAGLVTTSVQVRHRGGTFARRLPTTDAEVVQPVTAGETVIATGRTADARWLRVQLTAGQIGWITAEVLGSTTAADLDTQTAPLAVVEPSGDPGARLYRPMYGIQLEAQTSEPPCALTPASGLFMQTPEDTTLTMTINGYTVQSSGTTFIQADDPDSITVHLIEGAAEIMADGTAYTAERGEYVHISADGVETAAYDYSAVAALPYELVPRSVVVGLIWRNAIQEARDNPLSGLTTEDTCTIAFTDHTNLRTRPGFEGRIRGVLPPNASAQPDARAQGSDGSLWWRVIDGAWVSSDATAAAGACHLLPMINTATITTP